MHKIVSFYLENGPYFKERTTFKFSSGITFVHGRNKQRRGPAASNGSGKSLLFSVLPNLLFNTSPVISKNGKQAASRLYNKDTSAGVRIKAADGNRLQFSRAGSKTFLDVNGEDTSSRLARAELGEMLGVSETEFFSLVYLDSRRPNSLQLGTSADRLNFITSLYRLDNIDVLRRTVSKEVADITYSEQELSRVKREREKSQDTIDRVPADIEERCLKTKTLIKKASRVIAEQAAAKEKRRLQEEYKKEVAKLKVMPKGDHEAAEKARKLAETMAVALEQQNLRRTIEETRQELDDVRSRYPADAMQKAEDARRELVRLDYVAAVSKPEKAGKVELPEGATVEALKALLKGRLSQIKTTQEKKERVKAELTGCATCPVCTSVLTKNTVAALLRSFDEDVEKHKEACHVLSQQVKYLEYKTALARYKQYEAYKKKVDELEAQAKLAPEKIGKLIQSLESTIESCKSRLKAMKPIETEQVKAAIDKLKEEERQYADYVNQKRAVAYLKEAVGDYVEDEINVDGLVDKMGLAVEKLGLMETEKAERASALAHLDETKEVLAELKKHTEDGAAYKALLEAYSSKGVKTVLIRRIVETLGNNMNYYAKHIFAEKFVFRPEVTDTQFHIWVDRKSGIKGGVQTSDVRHLSGAESRLFNLLLVLAILPTIPSKRRMSCIVLDEPEVGMDAETLDVFSKKLLPALAEVVPSVVVITPRNDYIVDGARIVTVVKEAGKSILVEGGVE